MADLAVWQRTIVDETGLVVPGAEVEVRHAEGGALAQLYQDRAGTQPLSNPVTADMSGFVRFFIEGGAYDITATGSGASRTWRFDATGRLQEFDKVVAGVITDDAGEQADIRDKIGAVARDANLSDLTNAEEARANLGEFATAADVQNSHVPAVLDSIRTNGYYSLGDGVLPHFIRGSEDLGAVQSADGTWWELDAPDVTIEVGPGGRVSTVNEALVILSRARPVHKVGGFTAQILLKSGFVMAEQVLIDRVDLGWITITAEDAVVPIDGTAITIELIPHETNYPIFGGKGGATLPTIGALFEYDPEGVRRDGVTVVDGSRVRFLPSEDSTPRSGIRYCRRGITVLYNSEAWCHIPGLTQGGGGGAAGDAVGVDFSYASNRALQLQHGSRASLPRSNFSHSEGQPAVYAIWGSFLNIYQSNISHSDRTAVLVRDGSVCCARECNVSDSERGFHALHGAIIDARSGDTGTNPWVGDGAQRCSQYGLLASNGSIIEAPNIAVDDSDIGAHASSGSIINMNEATATGCRIGVYPFQASTIEAVKVDATACTSIAFIAERGSTLAADEAIATGSEVGFRAESGSTISANAAKANDCDIGFHARDDSRISAIGSEAKNCNSFGYVATDGSHIGAPNSDASGSNRGYEARHSCEINARSAVAHNCGERAFSCIDGGNMNVNGATATNAGAHGLTCRGGRVSATGASVTNSTNTDFHVQNGGIIAAHNSSGTLYQPENTLTQHGIIFK